jgi:hypothetical protein
MISEKMLDLRLRAYPQAFKINDRLRGELLFRKAIPPAPAAMREVLAQLQEWHRAEAGFLLTRSSIEAYRALRNALAAPPSHLPCSQEHLTAIFKAKNELRGALKSDLRLLYEED